MSLIKCPECGKNASDKALSCPNCGYPISSPYESEPLIGVSIDDSTVLYFNSQILEIKQGNNLLIRDRVSSFSIMEVEKDSHPAILIGHNQMGCPVVAKMDNKSIEKLSQLKNIFNDCTPLVATTPKPKTATIKNQTRCPKCKSTTLQYLGQENFGGRDEKTKTTTSLNLNPLKPFTVFNHKEKVVKKAKSGINYDRWRCQDCGKIFTTL